MAHQPGPNTSLSVQRTYRQKRLNYTSVIQEQSSNSELDKIQKTLVQKPLKFQGPPIGGRKLHLVEKQRRQEDQTQGFAKRQKKNPSNMMVD